jgi:hypothetical protein
VATVGVRRMPETKRTLVVAKEDEDIALRLVSAARQKIPALGSECTTRYGAPAMPSAILDPKHWRERAQEARVQAEHMTDAASKRTMLAVAEGYERLAKRVEERMANRPTR